MHGHKEDCDLCLVFKRNVAAFWSCWAKLSGKVLGLALCQLQCMAAWTVVTFAQVQSRGMPVSQNTLIGICDSKLGSHWRTMTHPIIQAFSLLHCLSPY
eukprot:1158324-Pelagomonas_calceolata.AAC.3